MQKSLKRTTRSEAETAKLGRDLAMAISAGSGAGDLLLLSGDLGAGKTALARSIIRHLAGDQELEVPSPTYTLCHLYEFDCQLAHYDLYRLSDMDELEELGWREQLETGSAIMEWPERVFDTLPQEGVSIAIDQTSAETREFTITGAGDLMDRIERSLEIADFLSSCGIGDASREHLPADASARSYEIINEGGSSFFLMNSPAMTDGPPVRHGRPYSQVAHLAESVDAFVAVGKTLRKVGASAPETPHYDLEKGLVLIEHLGDEGVIDARRNPVAHLYERSIEFLAELHQHSFAPDVQIGPDQTYRIPTYDMDAILIEAELLLDWYAPAHAQCGISDNQSAAFKEIWRSLYEKIAESEQSLVLRDFHSPNILWMPEREGTRRIGVIDFQDALIGPSAYDVASLAQDARVDVSAELENTLIDLYIECRNRLAKPFDEGTFRAVYAIMAAQRATKILGIFTRLDRRDGKPHYLKHLPRMRDYLKRSLSHPALADYREWVETVIKL